MISHDAMCFYVAIANTMHVLYKCESGEGRFCQGGLSTPSSVEKNRWAVANVPDALTIVKFHLFVLNWEQSLLTESKDLVIAVFHPMMGVVLPHCLVVVITKIEYTNLITIMDALHPI